MKPSSLKSLSTVKDSGKNGLSGSIAHHTVRILLVIHILATAYLPSAYVNLFQNLATRIVVALIVVALLFWDVIAGALLAILLVLTIQESKSRQVGTSAVVLAASHVMQVPPTSTLPELVHGSVYGTQQAPMHSESDQVGAYMKQIGELGISAQIRAGQGVQMVDGVPSMKANMDQLSQPPTGLLGLGKEGMSAASNNQFTESMPSVISSPTQVPTVNLGVEYDHPANKTMSENLKAHASGFITDKNLLDAQINSVSGLDGAQPPCFVASESGIWNAQGFGSIARAVDNEDCPHSFV
jgi:hypothetical protein